MDVWTTHKSSWIPYLGITVHWIDKNWEMQHMLLDLVYLGSQAHTGAFLGEKFMECLTKKFGIPPSKVSIFQCAVKHQGHFLLTLLSCRSLHVLPTTPPTMTRPSFDPAMNTSNATTAWRRLKIHPSKWKLQDSDVLHIS